MWIYTAFMYLAIHLKYEKIISFMSFGIFNKKLITTNNDLLTDDEVKEKYSGLNFTNVHIVSQPNVRYNILTGEINSDITQDLISYDKHGCIIISVKNKDEIIVNVDTYNTLEGLKFLDPKDILIIFRHNTDKYRYKIIKHNA